MAALWIAIISLSAVAQTTQLATLQHQDQVSIYYGAESLKEAVAAAADGDVITLSAGQFDAVTFDKELTVRGAGMGIATAPGYSIPTVINGSCSNTVPIKLESLSIQKITVKNDVTFTKCKVESLAVSSMNDRANLTIIQSDMDLDSSVSNAKTLTAVNSKLASKTISWNSLDLRATITNCILTMHYSSSHNPFTIFGITFFNSIIKLNCPYSGVIFSTESSPSAAYNCIICGENGGRDLGGVSNGTNLIRSDLATVFKEDGYYELLDEFKTFATTDGKEVGIYGGNLGFSQTSNNPQIKKFSVAPRTSADGKLSVEIEVEGLE